MICTQATHEEHKRTSRWLRLPFQGVQHVPADKDGPAERLELRTCRCGSTLGKVVVNGTVVR